MEFNGQYLTYKEYRLLGGTLDIAPFNLLEFEARQNIDKYTYGRLKELTTQNQEVKLCVFKLLGMIDSYNKQEVQNKSIASEHTDGYSISYATPSKDFTETKANEIKNIIKEYLLDCKLEDGTPYLYCGADK